MPLSNGRLQILVPKLGEPLVKSIDEFLADSDSIYADTFYLAQRLNTSPDIAGEIGCQLVELGLLTSCILKLCSSCNSPLADDAVSECSRCHTQIADRNALTESLFFERSIERSRDVGWLIAIHGMATTGQWQQELQWLVDLTYKQTVPFANWKYGRVQLQPLVGALQRRLVKKFVARLQSLAKQSADAGVGDRPDVVAHSFGTWLLGHALRCNPDLRVGRVILLGSILRPDFDWRPIFERHQVESVLNHYGTKDRWSRFSVRAIPDAGPSGAVGFLPGHANVYNIGDESGHSSFFEDAALAITFNTVWRRFLRDRLEDIPGVDVHADCPKWTAPLMPFRAPALIWLSLALMACVAFGLAALF